MGHGSVLLKMSYVGKVQPLALVAFDLHVVQVDFLDVLA